MKKTAALFFAAVMLVFSGAAEAQETITWFEDFQQASQVAGQQGRLVLLHFYSDDCVPCVKVERNVFSQPVVAQAIERSYVAVKVHVKKQPQLATRYNVTQWPTDVVVSPAGQEIFRTVSPQSAQDYVLFVSQIAAQAGVGLQSDSLLQAARTTGANAAAGAYSAVQQQTQTFLQQNNLPPPPGFAAFNPSAPQAAPFVTAPPPAAAPTTPTGQPFFQPSPEALQQAVAQPQPAASQQYQQNPWVTPNQPAPAFDQPSAAPVFAQQPAAAAPYAPQPAAAQPAFVQPNAQPAAAGFAPAPPMAAPVAARQPEAIPASIAPPTSMEGYCPVTLRDNARWVKGDRNFGAVHRGRTYLFASAAEQQKFLADPDAYSPTLSGCDTVKYSQSGQMIDGKRSFGVKYGGKVYLFSDLEARRTFEADPARFAETAYQAMRQSDLTGTRYR